MSRRTPTLDEIEAFQSGMGVAEFRRRFACGGSYYARFQREYGSTLHVPDAEAPRFAAVLELHDDDLAIAGDWHVPHHSVSMVKQLLVQSRIQSVTTLVINGDFLDASVFFKDGHARRPSMESFRTELNVGARMLTLLLEQFEHIVWIAGNHEQRLFRLTQGELDMELLRRMMVEGVSERVLVTDRDYILAHYGETTWRITHGQGGSAVIATNAAVLKAESLNCNVIQGHNHLFGLRQTRSGRYIGVDHGCMLDPALIEYKNIHTTTYPSWTQGFALLRRGHVFLYAPQFTSEFATHGP